MDFVILATSEPTADGQRVRTALFRVSTNELIGHTSSLSVPSSTKQDFELVAGLNALTLA